MNNFKMAFTESGKGTLWLDGRSYAAEVAARDSERLYRFFVYPKETNSKGEKITLEFSIGFWGDTRLWDSWVKLGWTTKKDTLLFLHTYVTDADGRCWGKYNPQVKLSDDGKRPVTDFDYLPEAKVEGYRLLINETMERFRRAE